MQNHPQRGWWERPCEEVWDFQLRLRRECQAMCSVAHGWGVGGRQQEPGVALETMDSGDLFYRWTRRSREKKTPSCALSSRPSGVSCLPGHLFPDPADPPALEHTCHPCCFPCEGLGSLLDPQWELPPANPIHQPTPTLDPKGPLAAEARTPGVQPRPPLHQLCY